jgi:Ni/Co efflux regulator RcnB
MKRIVTMMVLAAAMTASVAVAQCPAACPKAKEATPKCETGECPAQVKQADGKCDKQAQCPKAKECPKAKKGAAKKGNCPKKS